MRSMLMTNDAKLKRYEQNHLNPSRWSDTAKTIGILAALASGGVVVAFTMLVAG